MSISINSAATVSFFCQVTAGQHHESWWAHYLKLMCSYLNDIYSTFYTYFKCRILCIYWLWEIHPNTIYDGCIKAENEGHLSCYVVMSFHCAYESRFIMNLRKGEQHSFMFLCKNKCWEQTKTVELVTTTCNLLVRIYFQWTVFSAQKTLLYFTV